ncbi:MAG: N-acetylmuramoyl-L-alanine amidase [Nitrospiria bacterium]
MRTIRIFAHILFLFFFLSQTVFAAGRAGSLSEVDGCCAVIETPSMGTRAIDPEIQSAKFEPHTRGAQVKPIADAPAIVANIRHSPYKDHTRVVIDLNRPVLYSLTWFDATPTLAIELSPAVLGVLLREKPFFSIQEKFLKEIEIKKGRRDQIMVLATFENRGEYKAFTLSKPDRLVIDVFLPKMEAGVRDGLDNGVDNGLDEGLDRPDVTPPVPPPFEIKTIVIDPGHGGKDPGATSRRGLTEKDIVLDIALQLRKLIQRDLKKRVIMTRDKDVFISLKDRTLLANQEKADLFISIHVNSAPKRHTKGIEVYLLGRATDEGAIATAARENATSEAAALDFQELILNDLEREFTLNASLEWAHHTQEALVNHLIPNYPTTALGVKQAPFFVLGHTEMPAILAEISFLSNRIEEKRLRTKRYRQHVAEALYKGIVAYIRSLKTGF